MPLTATQRRQINRQNAANSTGPKSDEGKERSRRNALKHGLRAEALDLPNEVPGAFEALADEWHDYYEPDSPGECALVDRAVYATVQLRRCAAFQAEAVGKRVREAEAIWDRRQADELNALDALFWGDNPALAVTGLKRTAAGCSLLLGDWAALLDILNTRGRWEPTARDKALRLCGQDPESSGSTTLAYLVCYYNLFTLSAPNPEAIAVLLDPKRVPPCLRGTFGPTRPTPDECRATLRELVALEVEDLETRLARLEPLDAADRAGAAVRALQLDGPEGALLLRYERMHDSSFHRAYAALLQGRKERARDEADRTDAVDPPPVAAPALGPVAEAPNEPNPDAGAELDPPAPNEPNPSRCHDAKSATVETSGASEGSMTVVGVVDFERVPDGIARAECGVVAG